jgi:hypothetical protein
MDLSFFPLTLEAVDAAAAESLCLFIASDERPLTGLAGLADWRLSGKLSRLLRSGLLTGDAGEAVLTPPGARLGFKKLFLFGVGPSDQPDEKLAAQIADALRKLGQAGVQEAAMQLPSRLSPDAGMRALVGEQQGPARAMVFGPDPQKYVQALSRRASSPPPAPPPSQKNVVKPALPQQQAPAPSLPKASPVPFAPPPTAPAALYTPPPVAPAIPETPAPPVAPAVEPTPPPPTISGAQPPVLTSGERKPIPPPPQKYVPPPPKPHVFENRKKKKR